MEDSIFNSNVYATEILYESCSSSGCNAKSLRNSVGLKWKEICGVFSRPSGLNI